MGKALLAERAQENTSNLKNVHEFDNIIKTLSKYTNFLDYFITNGH